jgi:hypothetical protein
VVVAMKEEEEEVVVVVVDGEGKRAGISIESVGGGTAREERGGGTMKRTMLIQRVTILLEVVANMTRRHRRSFSRQSSRWQPFKRVSLTRTRQCQTMDSDTHPRATPQRAMA